MTAPTSPYYSAVAPVPTHPSEICFNFWPGGMPSGGGTASGDGYQKIGFLPMYSTNGPRMAKRCISGHEVHDVRRRHLPGLSGNLILRAGRTGRDVIAIVRYFESAGQSTYLFDQDADRMVGQSIDVETEGAFYYYVNAQKSDPWLVASTNPWSSDGVPSSGQIVKPVLPFCNLMHAQRLNDPVAAGNNVVFFDAMFSFTWDY